MRKLTYEFVKGKFEERGYILLSTKYEGNNVKLKYLCSDHGEQSICYNDLKGGHGCKSCGDIVARNSKKLTYEYVLSKFIQRGYTLLSNEYINSKTKLRYVCPNKHHGIQEITYDGLNSGYGCPKCGGASAANKMKLSIEEVRSTFLSYGYTLLSDKYINNSVKLRYLCTDITHGEQSICYNDLRSGHGCPKCKSYRATLITGKDRPSWRGGITELSRHLRNKLSVWTSDILKNSSYSCFVTGLNGDLQVHHMTSFQVIRDNTLKELELPVYRYIGDYGRHLDIITKRFLENNELLANPIVMLKEVHEDFHRFCGGNDKETSFEQLEEFKKLYTRKKTA